MHQAIRGIFWFITAASVAGCASVTDAGPHLQAVWAQQSICVGSWEKLLDDWKSNGGGIRSSLAETRRQIAQDQGSRFASLVRATWAAQSSGRNGRELGQWPLPADSYRSVVIAVPAKGLVPHDCEVPIYLDNWLYREIGLGERRLSDMPPSLDAADATSANHWLFYWLFVRVDDQVPAI